MIILGIETSCDDTGIALYNSEKGLLYEYTYIQEIHKVYGGTVPELASKDHLKKIFKIVLLTLKNQKILLTELNFIAYTIGPGLKNSLLIGILVGKTMSFALNIPCIGVNHLKSHIAISFLFNSEITFPLLVLFLSGANSLILEMYDFHNFLILKRTLDDSVGEVFDKIARALRLVPSNGRSLELVSSKKFVFSNLKYPSLLNSLDFSFSGIKSAVTRYIDRSFLSENSVSNIAYNFQNTLVKIIVHKCVIYFLNRKYRVFIFSGGVSANKELRLSLRNYCYLFNIKFCTQPLKYCTDNGAMIAFFGFINVCNGAFDKNFNFVIKPDLNLL